MFIIAGTKGVTSSAGSGRFYCPKCAARRDFVHKRVHKAATVFFMPVAKMSLLGEYVECQSCLSTYDLRVLDFDPEREQQKFEAEYFRALKRTITMMMFADGRIDDVEIKLGNEMFLKVAGEQITKEELLDEIRECRQNPQLLTEYLRSVAPRLNDVGKELLIKAAWCIALADRKNTDREKGILKKIREALGISAAHLSAIIMEPEEEQGRLNYKLEDRSETSLENRVLCGDGNCIGIVGPNGRCNVCGKLYNGDEL